MVIALDSVTGEVRAILDDASNLTNDPLAENAAIEAMVHASVGGVASMLETTVDEGDSTAAQRRETTVGEGVDTGAQRLDVMISRGLPGPGEW